MKIVVTSPSFCKDEQLRNETLRVSQDVVFNLEGKRFDEASLIEFIKDADAVIIGLDQMTDTVLADCPKLKIVSKYGVGLDNVDLESCKKRGIQIGWTGGVNKLSVAEMVLGDMLSLSRNLYVTSNQLKNGNWNKNGGFQLSGKTVGIIGFGHIGKEVARLLEPFHCRILVNDLIDYSQECAQKGYEFVSKEMLFQTADVITIHTPKTAETTHLINQTTISQMKDGVLILNTARGGIVQETDLINGLKSGKIGGAALDVYETEPPTNQELLAIPNLINTPHTGGNSQEAVRAMGLSAIEHLKNYTLSNK